MADHLPLRTHSHAPPPAGSVEDCGWFEALFRAHHAALCTYVYGYVASSEAAEDVVQDLFVAVWENREAWKSKGDRIRAALHVAARNKALDLLKYRRVRTQHAERVQPKSCAEPVAQDELLYRELRAQVDAAIATLPARCGLVFSLSREGGLTYPEIAELLGLSVKTVETQMGRALRTLRDRLIPLLLSLLLILVGR